MAFLPDQQVVVPADVNQEILMAPPEGSNSAQDQLQALPMPVPAPSLEDPVQEEIESQQPMAPVLNQDQPAANNLGQNDQI